MRARWDGEVNWTERKKLPLAAWSSLRVIESKVSHGVGAVSFSIENGLRS